jgi:hypothetical protein
MNAMRFEVRAIRARRREAARIDPLLPIFVVAVLAVFGCFYEVGRATDAGSARTEPLASLPTSFHSAATAIRLSDAPPIGIPAAVSPHAKGRTSSEPILVQTSTVPAQAVTHEVSRTPLHLPQPAGVVSPAPAETAPAPASPAPPSTNGSSGNEGSGSKPSSGGGGSFDSSG